MEKLDNLVNIYDGLSNDDLSDISNEDYKQLCIYAFDVIILSAKKLDQDLLKFPEKFKDKNFPLFVTWSKGEDKCLRGCIGTFSPDDLEKNLMMYSYYAAFKDHRFLPISLKEIPHLHCSVSLLVNFEEGKDALDWEVGKHGIQIDFRFGYRKHKATFLPEIASDRNWDKHTTLKQLVQKSGYYGRLDEIINKIKLVRYESIKVSIPHSEYKNLKIIKNELDFLIN
jgi:AMME syndrome candidate gene 1 protein